MQLASPDVIKEYVKAYREERNRTEFDARRRRSSLEREHTKSKAEIQRIIGSIAKGIISDGEAAIALGPARLELARIEAEIVTAETHTNVVELHPQAVQRFKENLDGLAEILTNRDAVPDLALTGSFRALVETVVVQPRQAGEEYEVRIRGYLAALMGTDMSALVMVARERYRLSTHQPNLRYFLRASA